MKKNIKRCWIFILCVAGYSQTAMGVEVSNWSELSSALSTGPAVITLGSEIVSTGAVGVGITATITGTSPNAALSGGGTQHLFNNNGILTLDSLIIKNNNAIPSAGGAMVNYNILIIKNSNIQDNNTSQYGGAIHQESGSLTVDNKTRFRNNSVSLNLGAAGYGGAIFLQSGTANIGDALGTAVEHVIFENNSAAKSGGAIFNDYNGYQMDANPGNYGTGQTTLNIGNYAEFKNNKANGGTGGGAILNQSILNIGENATFDGNTSLVSGGAIAQAVKTITVTHGKQSIVETTIGNNSTFTDNTTTYFGGAVYNESGKVTAGSNVSFSSNSSGYGGGAIFNAGTMTIEADSIFSNNSVTTTGGIGGGAIANYGQNGAPAYLTINGGTSFINNTSALAGGALANYDYATTVLDTTAGDIVFTGNKGPGGAANGIHLAGGIMEMQGINSVTVNDGISGAATAEINLNSGKFTMNGDGSSYVGKFIQNDGITKVTGTFLNSSENTIKGGNFILAKGAKLTNDNLLITTGAGTHGAVTVYDSVTDSVGQPLTLTNVLNGGFIHGQGANAHNITITNGGLYLANGTILNGNASFSPVVNGVLELGFLNGSGVKGNIEANNGFVITYGDGAFVAENSKITLNSSKLNFINDGVLNYNPTLVSSGIGNDITKSGKGTTNFGSSLDGLNGNVSVKSGILNLTNKANSVVNGNLSVGDLNNPANPSANINAQVNIASGNAAFNDVGVYGAKAVVNFGGVSNINNLTIQNGTVGLFGNSQIVNTLSVDGTLSALSGKTNTIVTDNLIIGPNAKFSFDVDPRRSLQDSIQTNTLVDNGNNVIIGSVNFITAPVDKNYTINSDQLIKSLDGNVARFSNTSVTGTSAIGRYLVTANAGSSVLNATLIGINPQIYRAQVATVASYMNQLVVNNILFDHMDVVSRQILIASDDANKYAAAYPQFAPYQYSAKDGGMWYKAYGNFEKLSMTQGLNVKNNAYGALIGADFPLVELEGGWNFIPTAYVAYNGGHQTYNGVGMYQNGGQLGAMGTLYKDNFLTSLLAYGGGYANHMSVPASGGLNGASDDNGNWFAGVASKTAYNLHLPADFVLQPTLLVSYNIFGEQNFHSDFGALSMSTGTLNGINVAPGFNLIWDKETFSIYATAQMMYNIMGSVSGQAGNVYLNDVKMKHSYFEYGLGVTKKFKERCSAYLQLTLRNGGRTGIGVQGGLIFRF